MTRKGKWSPEDRKKLIRLVERGVPEQDIRKQFKTKATDGQLRPMTAVEFAQQLKTALVEAGKIKQAPKTKNSGPRVYKVTAKGRLTIADFSQKASASTGDRYRLKPPQGRSKTWKLVPID